MKMDGVILIHQFPGFPIYINFVFLFMEGFYPFLKMPFFRILRTFFIIIQDMRNGSNCSLLIKSESLIRYSKKNNPSRFKYPEHIFYGQYGILAMLNKMICNNKILGTVSY